MTTYFPSSSNQRDVVPTLYVRDQTAASYSEAPVLPNNMMMYMNYSSAGSYSDTMTGNSQQHQSCVEIPSVGGSGLTTSHQGLLANLVGSHAGDPVYSAWRDGRNEMFMQPMGGPSTIQSLGVQMSGATDNLVHADVEDDPRMGLRPQLGILDGGQNLQGQGLSLSLSTQFSSAVPVPSFQFRHPNAGLSSLLGSHPTISGEGGSGTGSCRDDENSPNKQPRNADYLQPGFSGGNHDAVKQEAMNNLQCSLDPKQMHSSSSPYGMPGYMSTIPNSKYLKATQQLLDEVVNVRKALKQHEAEKHQGAGSKGLRESEGGSKDSSTLPSSSGMPTDSQEQTTTVELSPAERQDFQNRLTKLLSMLDEVDRRYRQYYHQMQIVVSSFDVIAGCGAAKPYTALALETISRHFRCLRDAISGQIKATRRSLGEKDTTGNSKGGGISRLRFVDQQLRQQRALQQLGMMQQHAWRPQRGLPESSVSILRAWLFEHFLHPYPKDSDKIMLARQTGLNRNQVSNWFINARVRLWKPMVEEMYKEEFGDIEMDSISSSENASKSARDDIKVSEDGREELQQNVKPSALERCESGQFHDSASNSIPDMEMSGSVTRTGFQNRSHGAVDMDYAGMRFRGNQNQNMDHSNLLQDTLVQSDGSGNGRFLSADAYQMAEMGRFGSGDGVSLTLGLQHCDGGGIPMSGGTHSNFVTMRGDEMYTAATSLGSDTTEYDCMDPDDRRHRFSSSHMMHDFVA